jgi:hypothetical protein
MRRKKLSKRRSKKMFTRNAVKVSGKNYYNPRRGGIRL